MSQTVGDDVAQCLRGIFRREHRRGTAETGTAELETLLSRVPESQDTVGLLAGLANTGYPAVPEASV